MRSAAVLVMALFSVSSSNASEIDPNNHAALCRQMAQNHEWLEGSDAVSNCACSMSELQKLMAPELFLTTLKWQLDPTTLSDILADDMSPARFYDLVGPIFGTVEAACGPMR